jgi:chromosome segregation ATPase
MANAVHGAAEIIKILREECRRSVKKEITSYDAFEYVSSEIPLFGKTVPIIAVKAKDGLPVPNNEKYLVPWVLDNQYPNCMRCNCAFTVFGRRHHCRACGYLVCKNCSNAVVSGEFIEAVKVDSRICLYCRTHSASRKNTFDASLHFSPDLLEAESSFLDDNDEKEEIARPEVRTPVDEEGWKLSPCGGSSKEASKKSNFFLEPLEINPETPTEPRLDSISVQNISNQSTINVTTNDSNTSSTTVVNIGEIECLKNELAKKAADLDEKQADHVKLSEEVITLRTKLAKRKQMLLETIQKVESLESTIAAQGNELNNCRDKVDSLQVEKESMANCRRELDLLQQTMATKTKELEEHRLLITEKDDEIQRLLEKLRQLQSEMQQQKDNHTRRIAELETIVAQLQANLTETTIELKSKEDQSGTQSTDIDQLKLEKENLIKKINALQQEVARLTSQVSAAENSTVSLQTRLIEQESQLADLQASQQAEKISWMTEVSTLKVTQQELSSNLSTKEFEIKQLQDEHQRLRDDAERQKNMLGLATNEQLHQLSAELATRDATLTKQQVALATREAELQTLKAESVRTKESFILEMEKQAALLIVKEGELHQCHVTIAARDSEVKKWREECERITQLLSTTKQDHAAAIAELDSDRHRWKEISSLNSADMESLQRQLLSKTQEWQLQRDEWSQTRAKLQKEIEALRTQSSQRDSDNSDLIQASHELKNQLLSMSAQNAESLKRITDLEDALSSVQKSSHDSKEALDKLQALLEAEKEEYECELARMVESHKLAIQAANQVHESEQSKLAARVMELASQEASQQEASRKELAKKDNQITQLEKELQSSRSNLKQQLDLLEERGKEIENLKKILQEEIQNSSDLRSLVQKQTEEWALQIQSAQYAHASALAGKQTELDELHMQATLQLKQKDAELSTQKERYETEQKRLQTSLQALEDSWQKEKKSIEQDLNTISASYRSLEEEQKALRLQLEQKQQELSTLSNACSSSDTSLQALQLAFDELQNEHNKYKSTSSDNEACMKSEISSLRMAMKIVQEDTAQKEQQFQVDSSRLNALLVTQETEMHRLNASLVQLEADKERLILELQLLQQERSTNEGESAALQQSLREQLSSLESSKQLLATENQSLTEQLQSLQDAHSTAKESHSTQIQDSQQQVAELKAQLANYENHAADLKKVHVADCQKWQDTVKLKEHELRDVQATLDNLRDLLQVQEQTVKEIKESSAQSARAHDDQLQAKSALIADLNVQLSALQSSLATLNEDKKHQSKVIEELRAGALTKASELEQLRGNLDSERASWTSQMSYQTAMLSAKDADLAMGQGQLATREVEYLQLSQAFSMLQSEKDRLQEVWEGELQSKERQLLNKEKQFASLQEHLALKESTIAPLKEDLQTLRALLDQQKQQHEKELHDVEADFVTMESEIAHYKEALDLAMLHPDCEEIGVQTDVSHEDDDLILHVPSSPSVVSFDPHDDLDAMSHISDDTYHSHHSQHSQQSMRSTATSGTSNTGTKRNFLMENKQKVTKLNSTMKSLTGKQSILEPSSAAKAKAARTSMASEHSAHSSFTSPPVRKSSASTISSSTKSTQKPSIPSSVNTNSPPEGLDLSSAAHKVNTSGGKIQHRKLNYILENKAEVKRTSEGVGILKKQSQQTVSVGKSGTVVTASVMSTAALAVLKQSISHETHAEFMHSNYQSLGELEGEKLQELATKASMGDLRVGAGMDGLVSPTGSHSSMRRKSSLPYSQSQQSLNRRSSAGSLHSHSSQQSMTSDKSKGRGSAADGVVRSNSSGSLASMTSSSLSGHGGGDGGDASPFGAAQQALLLGGSEDDRPHQDDGVDLREFGVTEVDDDLDPDDN